VRDPFGEVLHYPTPELPESLFRNPRMRPRDEFYLKTGKLDELSNRIVFGCEAFSQHAKPETFGLCVLLDPGVSGARIDVVVAAANVWAPRQTSKARRLAAHPAGISS
jgi:hypothetical protein